ncbi:hypothetical protein B0I33_106121 [Prauserella shujinwangii]|uniref:Uncharacterized protein n=1 Tax=Prauserella shujinwangii TaxID=1453103 RepID=A0A2T0LTK5_9PSEU|nr:hypothetical protein [Prauserella shujinwangii]PRX47024.1 hypothetical protein B0I33_106121 [Prauserella shujinwangii]
MIGESMCEARHAMHGDPEAMRRFAERLAGLSAPEAIASPPQAQVCAGGSQACSVFTAADLLATLRLAGFLAETGEAIETLRAAAAVAAEDYLATDQAGARAVTGVVAGVVLVAD